MIARFSRLYPLFILFFILEFFTLQGFNRYNLQEIFYSIPLFVTMSQSWFYTIVNVSNPTLLPHMYDRASIAWSISSEFLMYCGYSLLLWLVVRDAMSRSARIVVTVMFCLSAGLLMQYAINTTDLFDALVIPWFGDGASSRGSYLSSFHFWFTARSPYFRFIEFAIGVSIAHLYMTLRDHPVGTVEGMVMPIAGLTCVAIVFAIMLPLQWRPEIFGTLFRYLGFYPYIAFIIFVCARYDFSLLSMFFSIRFFILFGEASYSIYLIHIFFYGMVSHDAGAAPILLFLQIITLWMFIFTCAHILYVTLEMPARRWLRGWLTRHLESFQRFKPV